MARSFLNPYHNQKLFFPYHLNGALQILNGEIPAPSTIEIDLTDHGCNQACLHCCFESGPTRKLRSIDEEQLFPFLKDAYSARTRAFELVGGGEPTLHRNISGIISGISDIGKKAGDPTHIGLVTNGVRLDRVFNVCHDLEWIRVSLDATSQETYSVLHGVDKEQGHFQRVLKNIREATTVMSKDKVRLGYLVVPPYNHKREMIFDAIALANDLGVKHIAFRPAFFDQNISNEA